MFAFEGRSCLALEGFFVWTLALSSLGLERVSLGGIAVSGAGDGRSEDMTEVGVLLVGPGVTAVDSRGVLW